MSDGDDDFMCEEDEDYGLVSFILLDCASVISLCSFPARSEVRISGATLYSI